MYHIETKNQATNQKNLHFTRFSSKDLLTDHYTPTEQQIYKYILRYQNHPWIKLSNATIADAVGCSIITVIRATNKFNSSGLVTKQQENRYSSNSYTLRTIVDHDNKRIIQSEYDIPNKKDLSLILVDSLFSKSVNVLVQTHARGNTNKHIFEKKRGKKRSKVMNSVLKNMILDNKEDPKLKDALRTPNMWEEIVTPTIQEISQLFSLNEQEQFKLIAFREDVLQHTLEQVKAVTAKYNGTGYRIDNRLQWILRVATNYSKENDIKIDWPWYYDLCNVLGMEKHVMSSPLQFTGAPKKSSYKGEYGGGYKHVATNPTAAKYNGNLIGLTPDAQLRKLKIELATREERIATYKDNTYEQKKIKELKKCIAQLEEPNDLLEQLVAAGKLSPWEQNQHILPLEARVEKWQDEVSKLQAQHDAFPEHDPYGLKGLLMRTIDNAKEELKKAELLLQESNEKQKLSSKYQSHTLESCRA